MTGLGRGAGARGGAAAQPGGGQAGASAGHRDGGARAHAWQRAAALARVAALRGGAHTRPCFAAQAAPGAEALRLREQSCEINVCV